jgi:hypothetical protein
MIDVTDAAVTHLGAQVPVRNPTPDSQESTRIQFGKGRDMTQFTFTIGGATKPQILSEGGSAGGNAGVVVNNENTCKSLVDEQQSLATADFDSNVVVPDQGISSGHQAPFSLQQSPRHLCVY